MPTIQTLRLSIDAAPMRAGANEAAVATKKVADGATQAAGAIGGIGIASRAAGLALGALGLGGGLFGILSLAKGAIDTADNLSKLSQKVGISVEDLSTLQRQAELSDASLGDLQTGLKTLSKLLDDARGGGKQAVSTFKDLGVTVGQFNGDTNASLHLLEAVANRFGKMEDGAEKTALAVSALGRSGLALIPLLNDGEKLTKTLDDARASGTGVSAQFAHSAEEFNDSVTRLKQSLRQFAGELGPLLGGLTTAIDAMTTALHGSPTSPLKGQLTDEIDRDILRRRQGQGAAGSPGALLELLASAVKTTAAGGDPGDFAKAHAGFQTAIDDLDQYIKKVDHLKDQREAAAAVLDLAETFAEARALLAGSEFKDYLDGLRRETDLLQLSDQERERAVKIQEAQNIAKRYGITLSDDVLEQLNRELDLRFAIDDLEARRDAEADRTRAVADATRDLEEEIKQTTAEYARLAKAREDATDQLRDELEALEFEATLYGKSADEKARLTALNEFDKRSLDAEQDKVGVLRIMYESQLEVNAELARTEQLANDVSSAIVDGLDEAIFRADSFTDALRSAGLELSRIGLRAFAFNPLQQFLSSNLFNLGSARGNVFDAGRVVPHALGDVIGSPSAFPMSDGRLGTLAEQGPEAIMPLSRGRDGRLGVRSAGGRSTVVNINVRTPDVDGFRRSQRQIISDMNRAVSN